MERVEKTIRKRHGDFSNGELSAYQLKTVPLIFLISTFVRMMLKGRERNRIFRYFSHQKAKGRSAPAPERKCGASKSSETPPL